MIYDSTGMFHWIPAKTIVDCTIDRDRAESVILEGHVVVCLFANPDSPLISLKNFVMPLRASNIHYDKLKHVVIVGKSVFLKIDLKRAVNIQKILFQPRFLWLLLKRGCYLLAFLIGAGTLIGKLEL